MAAPDVKALILHTIDQRDSRPADLIVELLATSRVSESQIAGFRELAAQPFVCDVVCDVTLPEHPGLRVFSHGISASSRCYWGAIRFMIRCVKVRGATGVEFSEPRINTGDFALLRIGADCCGALRMD